MDQFAQKILDESKWLVNVSLSAYGEGDCKFYGATAAFSPRPNRNCIQYAGGADFESPDKAIEKAIFEAYERYSIMKYQKDHPIKIVRGENSSGVAVHVLEYEAKRRAILELVERDAIMKFWFYKEPAKWLSESNCSWLRIRNEAFRKSTEHSIIVFVLPSEYACVVLATIVGKNFPFFVSGAAASFESLEEAVKKAVLEAEFSFYSYRNGVFRPVQKKKVRTPIEHGLYYAESKRHASSLSWIYSNEEHCYTSDDDRKIYDYEDLFDSLVFNYTDLSTRSDITAVRVTSPDLVPIIFGYGNEPYGHPALDKSRVKRVDEPHFFA